MGQRAVVDLADVGPPRLVSQACADIGRLSVAAGVKRRKVRWALGLDPGGASLAAVRGVTLGLVRVVRKLHAEERRRADELEAMSPPWMTTAHLLRSRLVWGSRRRVVERLATIGVVPSEVAWPWGDRPVEEMMQRGRARDLVSVYVARDGVAMRRAALDGFSVTPTGEALAIARLASELWQCWATRHELERRGATQAAVDALLVGVSRGMSEATAHAAYDVLARECGADESETNRFVEVTTGVLEWHEYRFCGALGFGGKVHEDRRRGPWVSCYREDETPERLAAIERANDALARLWATSVEPAGGEEGCGG